MPIMIIDPRTRYPKEVPPCLSPGEVERSPEDSNRHESEAACDGDAAVEVDPRSARPHPLGNHDHRSVG